jgi:hypothetical protein|tara:strand:- start:3105 stop:3704 length:600 start_codon:yes stop_codon:yes gene_type:complete
MKKLKKLTILIDYIGHPSMNGAYLNDRRFDALHVLLREDKEPEKVIVSIGHIEKKHGDLQQYKKYYEKFLELKKIANHRGRKVKWIDIREDISISNLIKELEEFYGYIINPKYTEINIGGTNLSGCLLDAKETCVSTLAKFGFKINLILPMCAEASNSGINDLEKTWKALSIVYKHLKNNELISKVEFVYLREEIIVYK